MKTVFTNLIFALLLWFGFGVGPSLNCPPGCGCEDKANGFLVNCANKGFKLLINPNDLPANTFELDLSNNAIETIVDNAFKRKNLTKFRKLNLSGNRLQKIAPDAFSGLNKLTRIDLSNNKLSDVNEAAFGKLRNIKNIDLSNNQLVMLNKTQFYGCKYLKNIDLSSNKLRLLPDGLFINQRNLRKIDLDLNPLICDCNLKWLVKWMINEGKDLNVQGRCDLPYRVKDDKITELNKKEMVCDKLDLPVMFFGPQGDQIAFKGDRHTFVCNSSWIPGMQITWYKDNKLITVGPDDKRKHVVLKFDPSKVVISTVLDIKQLTVDDSGYYSCSVTHKGGYLHLSRSHLAIIPSNAKFCRAASTETDKGTFHWHHTAAGGFAFLPCPVGVMSSLIDHGGAELMARRNCSLEGVWMAVEAQSCAHANEITRALYDLKQKTVNDTTVAAVSHQLLNISKRAREYSDTLDVVYGAEVVVKLAQVIGRDQVLNENLVDTLSNIMETDVTLLKDAQRISKACSSMVIHLNLLATRFPMDLQSDMAFVSKNIAVYVVQISQIELAGKMCYVTTGKDSKLNDIDCLPCVYNMSCKKQMLVDTSIYLPPSLFRQIPSDVNVKFQFIVYSNSKLFPEITNGSETARKREVSSSVMSAQFGGIQMTNLSHPVILKFRNHQLQTDIFLNEMLERKLGCRFGINGKDSMSAHWIGDGGYTYTNGEEPIPVYWDHEGNGELGSWKMNTDCNKVSSQDNSTITECSQLSNKDFFAIMMSVRKPAGTGASGDNSLYLLPFSLELIVFVGAGISILFILTTLIVYSLIRDLRFGRDDAAMLMNHCLALIVTIVVFVTGINQVTNVLVCRSVGVLLHYFLLCSLLWIGCGGICLHRLIRTAIQPEEYNPVLRYYMTSWGIPLIICGITIAGNPDNYNVHDYCLLRRYPFYGALVGPACLIVLIDLVIFLRVFDLISRTYDSEATPQPDQETEVPAEENALVIQQEPLPDIDETGDIVDKSALPDKKEMIDHLRGSCVILLLIIISVTLGVLTIRYQQPRALYIALNCLFAVALVVLGALVFVFYCYRKEKVRLFGRKCCKCWCLSNKHYEIQQETPQTHIYEELSPDTGNGQEVQFTGDEIHGAKNQLSQGDEDSQSNVSLPYSAVIRIDKQDHLADKEAGGEPEKAPSVSDKQSCTSAPLPMKYKPRGKLLEHPPGHRHSYTESTRFPPSISEDRRAPLAPPEGTASSVDSSIQFPTDTASNVAPSECHSSVREAADPLNVSRHTNTSCSASEVSITIEIPSLKRRPPIPGSSSHGSDGAPPLPFKKIRTPLSGVQPVPSPAGDNLAHYSIAETPTSGIPRQIPRDHVVVRERYHIPYEPRALSEKPRDHYQILPLPTNRRDHYILQPGLDVGPNSHNQYQVSPDNYQMPDDQNPGQRTYDQNQIPSPTQGQTFYHITRDQSPAQTVHDLYQIARDMPPSPRLYENYQVPHEQIPPQIAHERYQVQQDHSPGQRTHDQAQRPLEHSPMSHDASIGQRSHDHHQVPRDHMSRDQPYDYIPLPADQNPAPRPPHERSTSPCHENGRDPVQGARDQNLTNDSAHGSVQEAAEKPHDQYAGEGPREQQQAVSPSDKSTTADKRPDVPLDKNGVRPPNAPRATREQPNGIHVPRRRSRNPYQIARDIHHNLGIETRSSRRSKRVPVEQRTQPQKTYPKDVVSSPGETPKERTPRSSMSSWKEERPKPAQKEWVSDLPKTAVFVPVPHLKRTTPEPPRNETSV